MKEEVNEKIRDEEGDWYEIQMRERVVYEEKDMEIEKIKYEEL